MSDNDFFQEPKVVKKQDTAESEPTPIGGKKAGFLGGLMNKVGGAPKDKSNTGNTQDDSKQGKKPNTGLIVGAGAVALVLIIGVLLALAMGGNDEPAPPTEQQAAEQTAEQQAAAQQQATEQQQQQPQNTDTRDYFVAHSIRSGLPADHWAKQADPIATLATQAIDRTMVKLPEWNPAVGGVNIANGVTYAGNSFEFAQLKSQATQALQQAINTDVQIHNDPEGKQVILERSSQEAIAAGRPEFDVIKTATAYDTIATNAESVATRIWTDTIAQARMALPPPAPEAPPAPVDTGISTAQRAEFNRLLQEADAWQKELVRENQRQKEELAQQQKQMVEILQQVEDNPKAVANMKAKMISTATDLKVQAVQGDLVFLEDKSGKLHTYRIGESLPGTDFVISNIDSKTGLVYVTKK